MESIEITTLEDDNEIIVVLAESKEKKPARNGGATKAVATSNSRS